MDKCAAASLNIEPLMNYYSSCCGVRVLNCLSIWWLEAGGGRIISYSFVSLVYSVSVLEAYRLICGLRSCKSRRKASRPMWSFKLANQIRWCFLLPFLFSFPTCIIIHLGKQQAKMYSYSTAYLPHFYTYGSMHLQEGYIRRCSLLLWRWW